MKSRRPIQAGRTNIHHGVPAVATTLTTPWGGIEFADQDEKGPLRKKMDSAKKRKTSEKRRD